MASISVYCTYKLKWKPLFDGKAKAWLDIVLLQGCITWEAPVSVRTQNGHGRTEGGSNRGYNGMYHGVLHI